MADLGLCRATGQKCFLQGLRCCACGAAALILAKLSLTISLSPLKHSCKACTVLLQIPTLHLLVYNDRKAVVLQNAGKPPKGVLQANLNGAKRDILCFTPHLKDSGVEPESSLCSHEQAGWHPAGPGSDAPHRSALFWGDMTGCRQPANLALL